MTNSTAEREGEGIPSKDMSIWSVAGPISNKQELPQQSQGQQPDVTTMKEGMAKVQQELELLRLDYLHSAAGLPLPNVRKLIALARLRPSSMSSCPNGAFPTWTIYETKAFGQVFLQALTKACRAHGVPMDVLTAGIRENNNADELVPREESYHAETSASLNKDQDLAQNTQDWKAGHIQDDAIGRYLMEAGRSGLVVPARQGRYLSVSPQLLEAVEIAINIVQVFENEKGTPDNGAGTLNASFEALMPLLPDFTPTEIVTALCCLRQKQQQQQKKGSSGWSARGTRMADNGRTDDKMASEPPCREMGGGKENLRTKRGTCEDTSKGKDDIRSPLQKKNPPSSSSSMVYNAARQPFAPLEQTQQKQRAPPPPPPPGVPPYKPNSQKKKVASSVAAVHGSQQQLSQHQEQQESEQRKEQEKAVLECLDDQILSLLAIHADKGGLSLEECFTELNSKIKTDALAAVSMRAVETCMINLEESYVAYRHGPQGKFKLL